MKFFSFFFLWRYSCMYFSKPVKLFASNLYIILIWHINITLVSIHHIAQIYKTKSVVEAKMIPRTTFPTPVLYRLSFSQPVIPTWFLKAIPEMGRYSWTDSSKSKVLCLIQSMLSPFLPLPCPHGNFWAPVRADAASEESQGLGCHLSHDPQHQERPFGRDYGSHTG